MPSAYHEGKVTKVTKVNEDQRREGKVDRKLERKRKK